MKKGYLRVLENPIFKDKKTTIYVACSGGPDSMATWDVFKKKYPGRCKPLFVHHRTNGSEQGLEIVRPFLYKHSGLFYYIKEGTTPTEKDWSIERKSIFKEVLSSNNCIIVTGHHLDDAVEEYLISCFKRSKAWTLKYNYPNKRIFRPMLINKKQNFIDYCNNKNIKYYDSSNEENLRNSIRDSSLISSINFTIGTNLDTIVRKLIHKDYECSETQKVCTADK